MLPPNVDGQLPLLGRGCESKGPRRHRHVECRRRCLPVVSPSPLSRTLLLCRRRHLPVCADAATVTSSVAVATHLCAPERAECRRRCRRHLPGCA